MELQKLLLKGSDRQQSLALRDYWEQGIFRTSTYSELFTAIRSVLDGASFPIVHSNLSEPVDRGTTKTSGMIGYGIGTRMSVKVARCNVTRFV